METVASSVRDSQLVLLLDDDSMVTESLAAGLERDGRSLITCNDLESAELMVDRLRPSHVVADIRLTGQFGFEGLDFIRFVKCHAPESRIILMSGLGDEALQLEASTRGAVAFLQKPFAVDVLDSTLDMIACSPLSSSGDHAPLIRVPLLDDLLISEDLRPFFQPIVALNASRRVFGYESLARFRSNSPLRNPDLLFKYAERKQRISDLEFACIGKTMAAANFFPASTSIFINVHPNVFNSGATLSKTLLMHARQWEVDVDRLVLEITEQGSLNRTPA